MSIFQNARVYWEMYGGVPPEGNDQHVQALNLNMDVGGWAADDYAYFQVSVYGRKNVNSPNLATLYSAPIHRPTGSLMWKPVHVAVTNADPDVRCVVLKVELVEQTFIAPDGSQHPMNYSDQYQDADAPPWGIRIHEASLYCSDLVRDVRAHRVFADILAGRGFTYSGPVATWTPDQLEFSDIPKDRWDALDDVNGMLGWNYACWDGTEVEFALPKSGAAHVIAASDPRTSWSVEESLDETYNAVRVCYGNKSGKPREVIVHGSTAALRGTVRADTLQAPESIKSEKAATRFAKRYLASHETKQVAGSVNIQGKAADVPGPPATGGTVTTDGLYTVHTFTDDGTLECPGSISGTVDGPRGGTCGAFGTGAATLADSMAVDVAADAVNYCTNPGFAGVVTNNIPAGYARTTTMVTPLTVERVAGVSTPYRLHVTGTTETGKTWIFQALDTLTAFLGGDPYTASIAVSGAAIPSGMRVQFFAYNAAWGALGGGYIGITGAGRFSKSGTLSAGTVAHAVFGFGAFAAWGSSAAVDFYVEMTQLEKSAVLTPYFDGSSGTGCAWSGAANASTSVFTGTVVVRYLTPVIVGLDPLLIRPGGTVKMTGPARSLSGTHEITRVTLRPLEWTADVEFGTNSKRFDTWLARLAAGAKSIKRR